MAVQNAQRYVAEAVESILKQTFGDFEFLILDDGSTDGSLDLLRRFSDRDTRIRLTRRPNRGLVASLNELIDQAKGEFIARMDADDISLPDRFQQQISYLHAHPEYVLVGSRVLLIDPDGDPLCDWCTIEDHEAIDAFNLEGKRGTLISHPVVMMRRSALVAVGKYRNFSMMEDFDLFLRLAEYGRLTNLPDVLLKYRMHPNNISNTPEHRKRVHQVAWEMIHDARQRRHMCPVPIPPEPTVSATTSGDEQEKWACWALGAGHLQTARKYALRGLAKAPFSPRAWRLAYCVIRGY
jgi:glycosyltransferase involved in cell wall biosynthesis